MSDLIDPHLRHDFRNPPRASRLRTARLRLTWWLTRRLTRWLQRLDPPGVEAELRALRWLVAGLTLVVVVETVMLVVAAQMGYAR